MLYIARSYHENIKLDQMSIQSAQFIRRVAQVGDYTIGFDATPPVEFGSLRFAKVALFPQDWYRDDTCKIQIGYCKGEGIPYFFTLEKLEQYVQDKKDETLL